MKPHTLILDNESSKIKAYLESLDCDVKQVENAAEALRAINTLHYHFLFEHLECDSYTTANRSFARKIKQERENLITIVYSGLPIKLVQEQLPYFDEYILSKGNIGSQINNIFKKYCFL